MNLFFIAVYTASCLALPQSSYCLPNNVVSAGGNKIAGLVETESVPKKTGESLDVVLSAKSAVAWDVETGIILYEKDADVRRPVASLSKLLTVLAVRQTMDINSMVEIPPAVRKAQLSGANITLPIGEHTSVIQLLSASMIASANDAAVALAHATSSSEEAFVDLANDLAQNIGLNDTLLANATGLDGGEQYSTANNVKQMMMLIYQDPFLRPHLSAKVGELSTVEGSTRHYETTNKLVGTYLNILAGKTGYTYSAGQNLVIVTEKEGREIGAVILGSEDRFHDMKTLVEWVSRNYTWTGESY